MRDMNRLIVELMIWKSKLLIALATLDPTSQMTASQLETSKLVFVMALDLMKKLNTSWKNKKISITSKIRLLKVIILSVALYGCQSWTLKKDLEARITGFEFKCYRPLLRIPYTEHNSNEEVKNPIE